MDLDVPNTLGDGSGKSKTWLEARSRIYESWKALMSHFAIASLFNNTAGPQRVITLKSCEEQILNVYMEVASNKQNAIQYQV